jgi:hypothetical protein
MSQENSCALGLKCNEFKFQQDARGSERELFLVMFCKIFHSTPVTMELLGIKRESYYTKNSTEKRKDN